MITNIVETSATNIARYLNKNVENSSSEAVLKLSLITIINFVIVAFFIFSICFFTGNLKLGLIAIICAPLLRYFSGGIHLKSANLCNIISASMILIAVHIPVQYQYVGFIFGLVSIVILFLYAPQGITNISRLDAKHYPVLKFISILIVASNFYFQSPTVSAVFFLQCLTILPAAQNIVNKYHSTRR